MPSEYIARSGHGVLIRLEESPPVQASQVVAAVNADRWRDRAAIAAGAERTFSREHYRDAYEKVLSQLAIRTNGHSRPRGSVAAPVAATVDMSSSMPSQVAESHGSTSPRSTPAARTPWSSACSPATRWSMSRSR